MISEKVKQLLEEHKNELRNLSKNTIKEALNSNEINVTDELVDFEHNFGGLKLIIANHEFQFGILWGGGYPFDPKLASIEYGIDNKYGGKKSEIFCSSNRCFNNFIIDETGHIFLGEEKVYENFEQLILEYLNNGGLLSLNM